tara:strand:- start:19547 stop:20983 length:1437 start_codon:yes stop_codon:yes gene_type:complete
MSNEQMKAELNRYFTAVVDEQYLKQFPDISSPMGTPLFYDDAGVLHAKHISEKTGMTENAVLQSFEAWKNVGNTPPTEKPISSSIGTREGVNGRRGAIAMPQVSPLEVQRKERREGSILSSVRDDMGEVLELRRLENELARENYSHQPPPNAGPTSDLTAVITALAPLLKQDRPSMDPMTMTLMKQLNDRTQDSTAQMIALFNMNQQSSQQYMTMLMETMRQGGSRTGLEDRLLNHSLDKMLNGGNEGPEESIWGELVRTGQLSEIVQGAAAGIAGIAQRRPPMGENPYAGAQTVQQLEPPVQNAPPNLAPEFEAPAPSPMQFTYQEKCTHIMDQMMNSLPDEWKSDGNTMQLLMNVVEVAVKRAEDIQPTDLQEQLNLAAKETLLVANLRLVGTSLSRIEKGEVPVELAANVLKQHPLWPVFETETADSLIFMANQYESADLADSPSLIHDLEYLNRPTTKPIIDSLLETAKGGMTR